MTSIIPPDRLAHAVAQLAAHVCDRGVLRRAIIEVGVQILGCSALDMIESATTPLCDENHIAFALSPGTWLLVDAADLQQRPEIGTYAAVAGGLLRQSTACEAGVREYAAVLHKLDHVRRDLDAAHRAEWVAAERIRIAQELHDRVAQTLFGLGLTADWLLAHTESGDQLRPDLERVKQMSATGLRQVREAIFSLSSAPIEPDQLKGAIRSLVRDVEAAGISAHMQTWGDVHLLPATVSDGLYQILREALVNVRRHARASSVLVSLRLESDTVTAVVQDDGVGLPEGVLDTYRKNGVHMGLRSMESRTERLGGQLTLTPGDEVGLIVTVTIPLRGASGDA